jgi:hypothetical protein
MNRVEDTLNSTANPQSGQEGATQPNVQSAQQRTNLLKLSTKVKAGAYMGIGLSGIGLNVGAGLR